MSNWQSVLLEPAKTVISQVSQFLINAMLVIIILLIGWGVAKLIKSLVAKLLKTVKIDDLAKHIELDTLLSKGGITNKLSELIGLIFYWVTLLVTVVVAVNAIGLTIAADLLNKVILYVPNIIAAVFILIFGMFMATLLKNIVQTTASNAGLSQTNLLSRAVEVIVVVFAIIIALEQLNIGARIIELTVSILLGSIGLGLALAFGLGCKDVAGKFIVTLIESLKEKK